MSFEEFHQPDPFADIFCNGHKLAEGYPVRLHIDDGPPRHCTALIHLEAGLRERLSVGDVLELRLESGLAVVVEVLSVNVDGMCHASTPKLRP